MKLTYLDIEPEISDGIQFESSQKALADASLSIPKRIDEYYRRSITNTILFSKGNEHLDLLIESRMLAKFFTPKQRKIWLDAHWHVIHYPAITGGILRRSEAAIVADLFATVAKEIKQGVI